MRGLALLLMMVDHLALVYGAPWGVRELLTRLAMPLFMLVAGFLWRPGWRWRHLEVFFAAVLATPYLWYIGGETVGILFVYLWALLCMPAVQRFPLLVLAVAIIQPITWPLAINLYQPGVVLALLALGYLARQHGFGRELVQIGSVLPSSLTVLGRWPLLIYVAHLYVFALLAG